MLPITNNLMESIIMKEIASLGVRGTGQIDKRYGTERTASYAIFECPI